jgi:CRISPR-associated exonuclease Cas4
MIQSYDRRKRDAAVLDFDDLLVHARDLVRDHEAVREAVGLRYKYLLVDEFQDTDRLQAEILFLIAAKQPPSTWHKAQLRPGSLFLVGDPKQAIYRFRGADIETYQLSRAAIVSQPSGAVLEITANFRSQRAILDHVNECFQAVFSKPFQPPYVALSATIAERSYGVGSVTRFTIEIEEKVYADKLREAEAARIAEICERLIGNIVVRRADNSESPLRAGDIALLSPSHAELWRYERALEARGLAVSSQAGQTLMRRQETQDVLALLRVLADPFDTLAFGALMRGPLVGLTDRELLDVTAALSPSGGDHPPFFTVQTDADLVPHPLARAVLKDLQDLRKRAATTSPSLILAEAIETLAARVIIAARYRNRNARALTNLDALIERARPYGVSGLRAFVRDLQADWERRTRISEGRIDAAENAVEFVTIHSAKGLEWPVVIPINSTTQLRRPDQFVYRYSDNSLHWMLGGVAPPDLAQARAEEGEEEARQRERIWYVACTRARDLLILPSIPQAVRASWFSAVDLGQQRVSEFDPSTLPDNPRGEGEAAANDQTTAVFAAEQETVAASAPPISWRRPSDHDPDRRGEAAEPVVMVETVGDRVEAVGAGALRGVILHKLMEEILIGELASPEDVPARASALLGRLAVGIDKAILPDPCEMAETALRTLSLPDIAALRPFLIPELPVWASAEDGLIAGRADALAVRDGSIEVAFDWKSDVDPTPSVRAGYVRQLRRYLSATGASRGAVVFMSLGEVVWVNA